MKVDIEEFFWPGGEFESNLESKKSGLSERGGIFRGMTTPTDPVNHPKHYNIHPSGIECIQVTEHMSFNLGNAVKYIWRAGIKNSDHKEDLQKALWYIQREIKRLER